MDQMLYRDFDMLPSQSLTVSFSTARACP